MKRIRTALLILALCATFAASAAAGAGWGYAQERTVKQSARQFVREMQSKGIDAQFKFYEDGSWHVTGCVSDGLCQD